MTQTHSVNAISSPFWAPCTFPYSQTILKEFPMKTNLSFANPAEVQTECLVVVALDRGEKDKTEVSVETNQSEIKDAVADVIASREVTAKIFEATLLHHPAKLKAKRLLLLGGG